MGSGQKVDRWLDIRRTGEQTVQQTMIDSKELNIKKKNWSISSPAGSEYIAKTWHIMDTVADEYTLYSLISSSFIKNGHSINGFVGTYVQV